jgi:hypothetical protein
MRTRTSAVEPRPTNGPGTLIAPAPNPNSPTEKVVFPPNEPSAGQPHDSEKIMFPPDEPNARQSRNLEKLLISPNEPNNAATLSNPPAPNAIVSTGGPE